MSHESHAKAHAASRREARLSRYQTRLSQGTAETLLSRQATGARHLCVRRLSEGSKLTGG